MVTLTNGEALAALAALREIAKREVPVPVALKIRRLGRELEVTEKDVAALRKQATERHGAKDKDGRLLVGPEGNVPFATMEDRAAFVRYMTELMEQTGEYQHTLAVADLGTEPIASELVMGLGPLLVEPDETDDVEV